MIKVIGIYIQFLKFLIIIRQFLHYKNAMMGSTVKETVRKYLLSSSCVFWPCYRVCSHKYKILRLTSVTMTFVLVGETKQNSSHDWVLNS